MNRKFKLVDPFDPNGIYIGKRAAQAALKAINKYCKKQDIKNIEMVFTIQECNGKMKNYSYFASRKLLETPKNIIHSNGINYNVKYNTIIHKIDKEPKEPTVP
jgi:hypothetical protein